MSNSELMIICKAIESGNLEKLKKIINQDKSKLNLETQFGTWLHLAAEENQFAIVKYLISIGIDKNKQSGIEGGNALNIAAAEGHIEIVRYLLSIGTEIDTSVPIKNPLFGAIHYGHKEIVELLVKNGADYKVKYSSKRMKDMDAAKYAKEYGQTEIADYLLGLDLSENIRPISKTKPILDIQLKKLPLEKQVQIFKLELKKAISKHYNKIIKMFPDIYGYSLYTVSDLSSFIPVANKLSDIPVGPKDKMYVYYRYGAIEWQIWDDFDIFEKVNLINSEILNNKKVDFDIIQKMLLDTSLEVMCELESEGCFGKRTSDRFLVICVADSDEEIMMKSVKLLNPKKAFDLYSSEFS